MKKAIKILSIFFILSLMFSTTASAKGSTAHSTSHSTTSKSAASSKTSKSSASKSSSKVSLAKSKTDTKIAKNNYKTYSNSQDYNSYTRNYYHSNMNVYYGAGTYHSDFMTGFYMYRTLSPYERVYCYNDIDYSHKWDWFTIASIIILAALIIIIFIFAVTTL